ncbi:MAG: TIGR02449 family protein [Pseudomonas sp.]
MEDQDLTLLAAKIDQLIQLNARLRAENRHLRGNERKWHEERARLVEQQAHAKRTIGLMISHLKSLEQEL